MIYHKVFVVFDSKVEAYHLPFFAPTTSAGMRVFSDACADRNTQFWRHPADFTLFEIAQYDATMGVLTMHASHRNLGTALELRPKPAEQSDMFASKE